MRRFNQLDYWNVIPSLPCVNVTLPYVGVAIGQSPVPAVNRHLEQ